MYASQQGHIHIVNMLMDNGVHVNLQDKVMYNIYYRNYSNTMYAKKNDCVVTLLDSS